MAWKAAAASIGPKSGVLVAMIANSAAAGMRDMRSASVAAALEAMPRAQDDARGMAAARLLQSGRGRAQAAGVYRMMTPSRRRVAWRSIAVSMRRARRKRRPWRPCEPHNTDDIASVIVANDIITVWILMSGLYLTGTPDASARTGGIGMHSSMMAANIGCSAMGNWLSSRSKTCAGHG